MTITRRRMLQAAALGGTLAAFGCTKVQQPATMTVGLTYIPNIQFSPFYVAQAQGLFAKEGLSVTLRHHGAQEDMFSAVLGGHEQVVCASSDEAVVAAAAGSPLRTFATMYQRYPVALIVPKAAGAKSIKDLAGKKVGLPGRFGSSYYGLLAALTGASMKEGDIQLTEIGYTGVSALLTNKVDAIVGFSNNEPAQFASKNFEVDVLQVVDPAKPNLVGPGLICAVDKVPTTDLAKLNAALLAAEQAILADPKVAVEATSKHVPDLAQPEAKANAEAVLAATAKLWHKGDGLATLAVDKAAFEAMSQLLAKAGIAAKELALGELVLDV